MEQKFLICEHCKNIIAMVEEKGVPIKCCGEFMKQIIPGTTDASIEKHLPVFEINGEEVIVKVGSVEHPMTEEHYIKWISLQTNLGNQRKVLTPNSKPETIFKIVDGEVVEAVYAYCNLHSLWKAQ